MPFDITSLKDSAAAEIREAQDLKTLEAIRVKYLGRQGIISQALADIPKLSPEERPNTGRMLNILKEELSGLIQEKFQSFKEKKETVAAKIDISLPGIAQNLGHIHPITQISRRICEIFKQMGFQVAEGPEIESEYNNFTALNIPLEHASREAFDTFYIKSQIPNPKSQKLLLRSHTSPVQIRVMKKYKPPLAVVVPGKVYRPDAVDASHSFMFHQVEGFLVDKDVKFSDLKGILNLFAKELFGQNVKLRFRPHFFPFTEPSAEVDISCIICGGKGCSVCGKKGWLEILGSGMIHPNVFKHVGIDAKIYTGFAFGMGVERIAMLKYGINDIRVFFENDLRFLEQF